MRKVSIEVITPATASRWLKNNNKRNRPISLSRLEAYTSDMENGRWFETNASIAFDSASNLVDGQHTLSSIVESGKAQHLIVVRGLNPKAMDSIDIGKSRSPGDVLGIHGETDTNRLAALLGFLKGYHSEKSDPTHSRVRPNEIMELLKTYPDAPDKMRMVPRSTFGAQRLFDGYYYVFFEISKQDANVFFEKVMKGIGVEESDPEYVLIKRLRRNKESKVHKLQDIIIAAYIVKTWNASRCNAKLKSLHFRETERFPTPL